MKSKKATYHIPAMHCASCEILMREEIETLPGIEQVRADANTKNVVITYTGDKPSAAEINKIITPYNYKVVKDGEEIQSSSKFREWSNAIIITMIIASLFFVFERWLNTNMGSIEGGLVLRNFLLGLLASVSTCAALVGGLILAQAKNWQDKKLFPYISFNLSRLVTFILLGGLLGLTGDIISPSIETSAFLVMIAAMVMIILGLQMLEIWPALNRLSIRLPGILSTEAVDNRSRKGFLMPAMLGAATFFLPCSFTLSAQLQAVSEASAVKGALVMGAFVLGTLPMLLFISFSSHTLALESRWQSLFLKVAGLLVIIFAVYTFNNQLNVLGLWSLHDLTY